MIITLCGSSRFPQAFELATMHLSLLGHVVIGKGLYAHADQPSGAQYLTSGDDLNCDVQREQDALHRLKIDLSDAVYVINPGGYIGRSTADEIGYAVENGKEVLWMFDPRSELSARV